MATRPKTVAVIGAGISGVVAAAQLHNSGLDVTVFERSHAEGGIWLYDERVPLEPDYSTKVPSAGDNFDTRAFKSAGGSGDDPQRVELLHAPPGPAYVGLTNNVGTRLLTTTLLPFPDGTPDYVNHSVLCQYIQDIAKSSGIHERTIFKTRVESVTKTDGVWHLRTSTFVYNESSDLVERNWDFDYVVVASGHYHAPSIPDIPGLEEIKQRWPNRIWHSKKYRKPNDFKDKNVLLIGAGVSSTDIAREIGPLAKKVYQTSREGDFDLPSHLLPENATRIETITNFQITNANIGNLQEGASLPVRATIASSQQLCNIDYVILATGYMFSLPFLKDLHNDELTPEEANDNILVTDGRQIHNLHKDIFYIPDPSLIFIGIPFYTATFSLFDFQAIVAATVLSGRAKLPSQEEMKSEYEARVAAKGYGRHFHSLREREEKYVNELLAWINQDITAAGDTPIRGHTEEWQVAKAEQRQRLKLLFAKDVVETGEQEKTQLILPVCS